MASAGPYANHASASTFSFYRPGAPSDAQSTMSKQRKQTNCGGIVTNW